MSSPYIGEIRMVGFSFAPVGWAFCDGQLIPISENDALFTLIGTTYGGDGQETFALPNLQSRIPVHPGGSNNIQLAEMAGTESVTLTTQQIPVHTHPMVATSTIGTEANPSNNVLAALTVGDPYIANPDPPAEDPLNAGVIAPAGGSQPHENTQPFLVINFVLSLFGIFPQQN
jgi:microcystin-dependent protein